MDRDFKDYHRLQEMEHLYNAAIKQLQLKFEVLNDEFRVNFARSPIHHVESRLKSTRSIINKLQKLGLEVTMESAMKNLNDLAGLRVVCCYIDDVYKVSDNFDILQMPPDLLDGYPDTMLILE